MKLSIYTSAFNLHKNGFVDWAESIQRFSEFADEVVISVNTSEDSTLESIYDLPFKNLKVVECDISYEDPLLDGKLKNEALQACSGDILVQLDMDEYVPIEQKPLWYNYAKFLFFKESSIQCYMFPSVNLYKDKNHLKDINAKWYMHKKGLFRGPVNFARKEDGTVDTNKSDTCAILDADGNLANRDELIQALMDDFAYPFVVHTGYIDLEARLKRNEEFWSEHWRKESGGEAPPHKVHASMEDFTEEAIPHSLKI